MTAKQMFKELGYEIKEDGKRYLRYLKSEDKKYNYYGDFVDFDKVNQTFRIIRRTHNGNWHARYSTPEELQAINKQIKELGWNIWKQ